MKIHSIIILIVLFTISCTDEKVAKKNSDFSIKDLNGEVVKSLPSDLLNSIHHDLIKKGRNEDALKLTELYNMETGILVGFHDEVMRNRAANMASGKVNAQYAPNDVFAYVHQQSVGDIGPFTQAEYLGANLPSPYAGIVGEGKRLEGMTLQTSSALLNTRPQVYYSLRNPNLTWTSTATWGQFTGTKGQAKAVIGLKIWTSNPGYSIWYIAHNQVTGWNQPWHNDGQFAGIEGKRLEAFAFHILQY